MSRVSPADDEEADRCVSVKILQTTTITISAQKTTTIAISAQKTTTTTNSTNYYPLQLWSLCRLIIAVIIVFRGVFDFHVVGAATGNDTLSKHPNRLMPRFLNGHYVAWPDNCDGTPTSYCDADTPPPKPPPYVYYVPDNVVFTRMQMAGDRAFIVSPRYRPGVPFTLGYVPLTDCAASTPEASNNNLNTDRKRNNDDGYHSVSPYPSLRAHCQFTKHSTQYKGKETLCGSEGLINVVDVFLGPDGILWILDIGVVDTLTSPDRAGKPKKYNDPKVLGIDVTTGTTVHKIMLGKLLKPMPAHEEKVKIVARSLCSIVVEYDDNGDKDALGSKSETQKKTGTDDSGMAEKKVGKGKRSTQNRREDGGGGGGRGGSGCMSEGDVGGNGDDSSDVHCCNNHNNIGNGSDGSSSRCNRKCSCSRCTEDDPPIVRDRRQSNFTSSEAKPKPVAVYVGDACNHDGFKGLIVVWLVNECRGIRVVLPSSVSTVDDDDSCDGDLDPGRNTLHMALLDDFGGRRRQRHLYLTYGRHPNAYRIPVTAFRDRGRNGIAPKASADLKLTSCQSTGSDRCVMNVGRKPISGGGSIGRPLVPVDSAYGMQWYFRDPAAVRRSDLYVWDARRTFHPEYFEQVIRGHVTAEVAGVRHSGGRSCVAGVCCGLPPVSGKNRGRGKDKGRGKDTGRNKDTGRSKDTGCELDYGCDDDDDDPCESCNDAGGDASNKNATATGGHKRHSGGRLSPGCMEITSVDYASTESAGAPAKDGYVLWALHSNIQDWVHGQTGRFGMTALLCPIVCNTAGD